MSDEISSGEGAQPPNGEKSMRHRRNRKLSGVSARALGELAFVLFQVCDLAVPDAQKWPLLKAKLLAWRGAFLP
jgi:hypothetical protein